MKCKYCNTEVKAGMKFCPKCGKELFQLVTCNHCGAQIKAGLPFCPNCGARQNEQIAEPRPITEVAQDVILQEKMAEEHKKGAGLLEEYLDQGKNVVYLTLGDPTVYCTFSYLQHILEADGYDVELVSGITSFCAAAARLNIPLTEWNEPLHVIPASHNTDGKLDLPGTYVLMKSASRMKETKEILIRSGRRVGCVENCGMKNEKVYHSAQEIPDDAGYFSLIIATDR